MSLIVSVSGIRGIVGETLTPSVVLEFAQAYGTILVRELGGKTGSLEIGGVQVDGATSGNAGPGGKARPRIVLARDSRGSGEMFASAAAAGLMAAGCEVTQIGIAMTPTAGFAIREGIFDGGLIITASHNPAQWNGMKLLDDMGLAPDPARAAKVAEVRDRRDFEQVREEFARLEADNASGERHAAAVLKAVEIDLSGLKGLAVVLDSINGAGCISTPGFLRALGCRVIHINGEPDGKFAHTPEPIAENLTQLCDAVRESGAAIGFAQDPDADRLAIVDERGAFIGEEYTLALAAESVLSRRAGPVAANLSTSRMIDDIAARHGAAVFRTPVGEAHVARAILANGCVVGGEGNGGVIDPRISPVRDSLSAMSLVLQLMAATKKPVSRLVADIPRYTMLKEKFTCPPERCKTALRAVMDVYGDSKDPHPGPLPEYRERGKASAALTPNTPNTTNTTNTTSTTTTVNSKGVTVNTSDGIRIDTPDGWVHIRASNTEPIIRVIAEAPSADDCRRLIAEVRAAAGL